MLDQPIASLKRLRVEFQTKDGPVVGVEDVSFDIFPGETVCIVGESGSGKSVSSLSLMRLVEFGGGEIAGGELLFDRGSEHGGVVEAFVKIGVEPTSRRAERAGMVDELANGGDVRVAALDGGRVGEPETRFEFEESVACSRRFVDGSSSGFDRGLSPRQRAIRFEERPFDVGVGRRGLAAASKHATRTKRDQTAMLWDRRIQQLVVDRFGA